MSGTWRSFCAVAMLIAVVAAPTSAQAARKSQSYGRTQQAPRDPYVNQRRYHGDPDPNVQFDLMREQNWRKGG